MERCQRSVVSIPGPSKGGHLEYTDYECRPFPLSVQDKCDDENRLFCAVWTSAHYFTELGIGFAGMALVALLIGVSTHSRRRRVWRAVAGLVILHGKYHMNAFATLDIIPIRSCVSTCHVHPHYRVVSKGTFSSFRTR
jgi:hypothetical protein